MARILSGADFGLGFPQGGGVANNDFQTQLSTQLIGQALQNQRQDELFAQKQQLQAQNAEQVQLATDEKTRLDTMFLQLDRIRNMPDGPGKKTALAKLGQAEFEGGRDGSEFIEALNAGTPDEFNLNISRLSTKAAGLAGQIKEGLAANAPDKPVEQFEEVKNAAGKVIAQRSIASNRVFANSAAVAKGTGLTNVKEAAGGGFIGIDENNQAVFIPPPQNKLTNAQAKAFEISPEQEGDIFKREQGLRKEFTALSKDFIKVRDAHTRVLRSAEDPSSAGDLALIFNYMKVLDPGSVVRESEFATAESAQAAIGDLEEQGSLVPNFVKRRIAKLVEGTRLLPEQRKDFVDRSSTLFKGQQKNQGELEKSFGSIAKRSKTNPENVVIKFTLPGATIPIEDLTREDLQSMTDEELQALAGG
jgi:hypothetical protein